MDLLLLDIEMHEMNGITALKKIRKISKELPVIIQTAYAFDENRELAKQTEASGFIAIPIRSEELWNTISRFIQIGNDSIISSNK